MAGFLKGGSRPPARSGGNREREAFAGKVSGMKPGGEMQGAEHSEHSSPAIGESKITHHEDGSHSVQHHDGEETHHPSGSHMATHMAAKHDGGGHGHIHAHEGGATTHHAGMDGEVNGPNEHGSVGEGTDHLAQMMEGDGQNNETSSVEPDGDETPMMG